MVGSIRIISAPRGPAPLWVREKWIGLELPVEKTKAVTVSTLPDFKRRRFVTPFHVLWWQLTGKLSNYSGYVVRVDDALRVLEIRHKDAAAWWDENAPHLRGSTFLFDAASCQLLRGD